VADRRFNETVTMDTRSMAHALRDLATLLEAGSVEFVCDSLRKLAARVEEMAGESTEGPRDRAEKLWGLDPQRWPEWICHNCTQRHSGWTTECGRCGATRIVPRSATGLIE
jgi:hypothetical protein